MGGWEETMGRYRNEPQNPYATWLDFYDKFEGSAFNKLAQLNNLIINQHILDESDFYHKVDLDGTLVPRVLNLNDFNGYFYSPPYVGYVSLLPRHSTYWKLGINGHGVRLWSTKRNVLEWSNPKFYDITSLVLRPITSLNFPRGV